LISKLKNRAGCYFNALLSRFAKQTPPSIPDEFIINGLPLPALLISLIQNRKWRHPGKDALRAAIPFHRVEMDFLELELMRSNTEAHPELYEPPLLLPHMREVRGSKMPTPVELPWLDVDRVILLAFAKEIGGVEAIALDYRASRTDPRVVANEWQERKGFYWREVTPTFTEFVERIGLNDAPHK
jgi:hypothetical protein